MDRVVKGSMISDEYVIEGLEVTQLSELKNPLGSVLHMFRCDAPEFTQFGECYFSEIVPGAVKAWKCHRLQTQNLAVPVGRVRTVVYDDRAGSPTRGQIKSMEMGRPDSYVRLRIPNGVWYGFECMGEVPALIVNCSDLPHNSEESEVRSINDPHMPYPWGT